MAKKIKRYFILMLLSLLTFWKSQPAHAEEQTTYNRFACRNGETDEQCCENGGYGRRAGQWSGSVCGTSYPAL